MSTKKAKNTHKHTKVNNELILGSLFLKNNIGIEDDYKVSCKICKGAPIYFENLRKHLKTSTHDQYAVQNKQVEALVIARALLEPPEANESATANIKDSTTAIKKELNYEKPPTSHSKEEKPSANLDLQESDPERPRAKEKFQFEVANFIIKNNLPFNLSEKLSHFINLLAENYSLDELRSFGCNSKNVTSIAHRCVGPSIQEQYLKTLENSPFSIGIDAGSLSNKEYLAINARLFAEPGDIYTNTKLIGLIRLKDSYEGLILHEKVKTLLFTGPGAEARKKNFMGISADHASNMISKKAGVAARLQQDFPWSMVSHDFCHALALILKESISTFPAYYVDLVNEISHTFSGSKQNAAILKEYIANSIKDRRIQGMKDYIQSRWSSFYDSVDRIIDIEHPLTKYYDDWGTEDQKEYFSKNNMGILKLLKWLIGCICNPIKFFERENCDILAVINRLNTFIINIAEFVLEIPAEKFASDDIYDYVIELLKKTKKAKQSTKACKRRAQKPEMQKPFGESQRSSLSFQKYLFHVHAEFQSYVSEEMRDKLCSAAQNFLTQVLDSIVDWLPLEESSVLLAANFTLKKREYHWEALREIGKRFYNIIPESDITKFNDEILTLKNLNRGIVQKIEDLRDDESFLSVWEKYKGQCPLLYRLARAIQTLPYSTASIERVFSIAGCIKTLKRNCLKLKNLQACLLIKQEYQTKDIPLTKEYLEKYRQRNVIRRINKHSKNSNSNENFTTIVNSGIQQVDSRLDSQQEELKVDSQGTEDEIPGFHRLMKKSSPQLAASGETEDRRPPLDIHFPLKRAKYSVASSELDQIPTKKEQIDSDNESY